MRRRACPITRIAISAQRFAQWHAQISIDLQQALEDHFSVPAGDCFQLFDCYSPGQRIVNPHYLCRAETGRSDDFLLFQITAGKPRSHLQKQRFYQDLVTRLEQSLGISPHEVMVVIGFTEPGRLVIRQRENVQPDGYSSAALSNAAITEAVTSQEPEADPVAEDASRRLTLQETQRHHVGSSRSMTLG